MADVDITVVTDIEGLDELEEAFTVGSSRAVFNFLARVEMNAAKVLVDALSEEAPYEYGDLSENIHRQITTNSEGMTVRVGPGQDTFWGLFQELGTPTQPGQHWMENAARGHQDEVLEEYYTGLTDGLAKMKKA